MNETFCTLIPALIMGNAVLFKPPRFGVLLYNPMLEAFRSAFPAGAINIVYGQGSVVVPHIMASGKVNVLALIGTSKGRRRAQEGPPQDQPAARGAGAGSERTRRSSCPTPTSS